MRSVWLVTGIALLALVGCSSAAGDDTSAGDGTAVAAEEAPFELEDAAVATDQVEAIKSYKFAPRVVEVASGSTVTWTNEDDFPHNVHFLTGSDETLDLAIGETAELAFDEPGNYYYECSIHPQQMRGRVIVTG